MGVRVGTLVAVRVGVLLGVREGVWVCVGVGELVAVRVGVRVSVLVAVYGEVRVGEGMRVSTLMEVSLVAGGVMATPSALSMGRTPASPARDMYSADNQPVFPSQNTHTQALSSLVP